MKEVLLAIINIALVTIGLILNDIGRDIKNKEFTAVVEFPCDVVVYQDVNSLTGE